jgi:hypothetical protein
MKLLALVGLAVTACTSNGSSAPSEFEDAAAEVEGIYKVQAYTRNDASCAPGGESLLGGERFAAVFSGEALGRPYLQILSCSSAADCRDRIAAMKSGGGFAVDFSFIVTGVGQNGALTGAGTSTGFGDGEVCREAELSTTLLTLAGESLRLEQAITIAADYPAEDGTCSTTAAQQAAEGATCSAMEVLTATFFEAL